MLGVTIKKLKNEKSLTVIMTLMYWKENHIKCDIATGKGKKLRDQRQDIKREIGNETKEESSKIQTKDNNNV